MTTETKKTLTETLKERERIAKAGRCSTCKWCIPCMNADSEFYSVCSIQGIVNTISLSLTEYQDRTGEPFPYGYCEGGSWSSDLSDHSGSIHIQACMVYDPRSDAEPHPDDEAVDAHRQFMWALGRAANLAGYIDDVRSGRALTELNAILSKNGMVEA